MNNSSLHEPTRHRFSDHQGTRTLKTRIIEIVREKVRLLTLLTLIGTVAAFLGTFHWTLELTSHFRVQYLAVAVICWVGLLVFRSWRWSFVGLLCVLLNGAVILPWYVGRPQAPSAANTTSLRIILSNVLTSNGNPTGLLELVRREPPDVLVLQEIDDEWVEKLQGLNASFPYSKVIPRDDNFGIGLWSRLPLAAVEEIILTDSEVPSILMMMELVGQPITLLATHPVPPGSKYLSELRNAQLSAAAALIRGATTPAILIGDLNITMWSPHYTSLIRDSGLVNARQGYGVLPSWPTHMSVMRIPLDHCLVSPAIGIKGIRTGEMIGSDHLPLIVDLAIPAGR